MITINDDEGSKFTFDPTDVGMIHEFTTLTIFPCHCEIRLRTMKIAMQLRFVNTERRDETMKLVYEKMVPVSKPKRGRKCETSSMS